MEQEQGAAPATISFGFATMKAITQEEAAAAFAKWQRERPFSTDESILGTVQARPYNVSTKRKDGTIQDRKGTFYWAEGILLDMSKNHPDQTGFSFSDDPGYPLAKDPKTLHPVSNCTVCLRSSAFALRSDRFCVCRRGTSCSSLARSLRVMRAPLVPSRTATTLCLLGA